MTDRTERARSRIGTLRAESTGRRVRRAARTRPYVRRLLSTPSPKPTDAAPRAALVRPYVLAGRPQRPRADEAARPPAPVRPYLRAAQERAQRRAGASRRNMAAFADLADPQAAARSGDTLDDVRAALAGPLRRLLAQQPHLAHPACAAGAERDLAEVAP